MSTPIAQPGEFVTLHLQTIDPETGLVLDTTFPALLIRNEDNPNPPAPDMKFWAHVVPFDDDGPLEGQYTFNCDPPRNGSYTKLNAGAPENSPAPEPQPEPVQPQE